MSLTSNGTHNGTRPPNGTTAAGETATAATTVEDLDMRPEDQDTRRWEEKSLLEQQEEMLDWWKPSEWLTDQGYLVGAILRHDDRKWYHWKALAKERSVDIYGYEKGVDKLLRDLGMQQGSTSHGFTSYFPRQESDVATPHEIRRSGLSSLTSLTSYPWPELAPEAFYGLAGDYVQAIAPHSESDPAALLIQFLATFGLVIGRHCYYEVEATRHYTNLCVVVAGLTSRARKGTSYAHIDAQMRTADPTWTLDKQIKGCGSGEGLVYAVRDPRFGREAIKEHKRIIGYQEVELDPGVSDKPRSIRPANSPASSRSVRVTAAS
jgi:hypothetical protein